MGLKRPPLRFKMGRQFDGAKLPLVAEVVSDISDYLGSTISTEMVATRYITALPHIITCDTDNPVLVLYKRLDGEGGVPSYRVLGKRAGLTHIEISTLGVGVPVPAKYRFFVLGGRAAERTDDSPGENPDAVEVPATYPDTAITSDPITSADGFSTLTGPTARDQFQQLLDGILDRQRNYEVGSLIESLGYRHEVTDTVATFLNSTLVVYGETAENLSSRWHVVRTSGSAGIMGASSPDTPNGTAWVARTATSFIALCGVWNMNATGSGTDQGRYCWAGASGAIATQDATTAAATNRTAGSSYAGTFRAVVHRGPNGFILAGTGGELQTSPTGQTWSSTYNTGGDFLHMAINDVDLATTVAIRAASFVHTTNGMASGFTDSALPLSGAQFIAFHKAHGWLVAGSDGTAYSPDGTSWSQVETSSVVSGTLLGLFAVGGGFLAYNATTLYWTSTPTVAGSWEAFTGGAPTAASQSMVVGVDDQKREVLVIWKDITNSKPYMRKSCQVRYV